MNRHSRLRSFSEAFCWLRALFRGAYPVENQTSSSDRLHSAGELVQVVRPEIELLVTAGDIPEKVEISLAGMEINDHVLDDYGYRAYYDAAFPDFDESERYSPTTSSFAISAFLRTMLTNQAPFQQWLKGETDALTENQKEGALLFFGKARCFNCHEGPALNAMDFHALGTPDLYQLARTSQPTHPS